MLFNVIPVTELAWSFSSSDPCFYIQDGTYKREEKVDPHPCYAHHEGRVKKLTGMLDRLLPLPGQTDIYLPAWEGPNRTNGFASKQNWYSNENEDKFGGLIVLNGKRIPLHPAMTRYLTVHEYGHIVQFWLEKKFSLTNLITAYIKDVRGLTLEANPYYGGRTWHNAPGEIFANDFRIAVCRTEDEFWPHEHIPHPLRAERVLDFWEHLTFAAVNDKLGTVLLENFMPSLERKKDKS